MTTIVLHILNLLNVTDVWHSQFSLDYLVWLEFGNNIMINLIKNKYISICTIQLYGAIDTNQVTKAGDILHNIHNYIAMYLRWYTFTEVSWVALQWEMSVQNQVHM